MPPPLPPPAEASVGMSAAALMAATVATAKIVLRIMGLSWFLLDVFSHPACQSGERSVGFNGASIKNERRILGAREGPRIRSPAAGVFGPVGAGAPPLSLPFGLCRRAALDRQRLRHALPRWGMVAISRRDPRSCVFLLEEPSNADRAYLFDHQTRCHRPQLDRCDQRHDRGRGLAYHRAKAHAHQPRAGGSLLCGPSRTAVLPRARRIHDLRTRGRASAR